jgi:hypothetical protein
MIVIGSLALDFSFQQLVTYPPVPKQIATAYMPATPTYSAYGLGAPSGAAQLQYIKPDGKMLTALKIGMEVSFIVVKTIALEHPLNFLDEVSLYQLSRMSTLHWQTNIGQTINMRRRRSNHKILRA